jgi:hypothetical protein
LGEVGGAESFVGGKDGEEDRYDGAVCMDTFSLLVIVVYRRIESLTLGSLQ